MPTKAGRLLMMYNRLKHSAVTIEIIQRWAKNAGISISQRQLYRDMDLINGLLQKNEVLKVSQSEKNRKTWKIEFAESSEEKVSDNFINSFYLLRNFCPLNIQSLRKDDIDKIEALFYRKNSKSRFEHNTNVHQLEITSSQFGEKPNLPAFNDLLNKCIWAVQNQRKILLKKLEYELTALEEAFYARDHILLPMQILYHRGGIYLAAIEEKQRRLIVLALVQMKEFETTNEMFDHSVYVNTFNEQLAARFGVTENISEHIYDIEIEFSQFVGEYISTYYWHPSTQISKKRNGVYIMNLRCGINRELLSWIFQFASLAKVKKPTLLREMVLQYLETTIELYRQDGSPAAKSRLRRT